MFGTFYSAMAFRLPKWSGLLGESYQELGESLLLSPLTPSGKFSSSTFDRVFFVML